MALGKLDDATREAIARRATCMSRSRPPIPAIRTSGVFSRRRTASPGRSRSSGELRGGARRGGGESRAPRSAARKDAEQRRVADRAREDADTVELRTHRGGPRARGRGRCASRHRDRRARAGEAAHRPDRTARARRTPISPPATRRSTGVTASRRDARGRVRSPSRFHRPRHGRRRAPRAASTALVSLGRVDEARPIVRTLEQQGYRRPTLARAHAGGRVVTTTVGKQGRQHFPDVPSLPFPRTSGARSNVNVTFDPNAKPQFSSTGIRDNDVRWQGHFPPASVISVVDVYGGNVKKDTLNELSRPYTGTGNPFTSTTNSKTSRRGYDYTVTVELYGETYTSPDPVIVNDPAAAVPLRERNTGGVARAPPRRCARSLLVKSIPGHRRRCEDDSGHPSSASELPLTAHDDVAREGELEGAAGGEAPLNVLGAPCGGGARGRAGRGADHRRLRALAEDADRARRPATAPPTTFLRSLPPSRALRLHLAQRRDLAIARDTARHSRRSRGRESGSCSPRPGRRAPPTSPRAPRWRRRG